MVGTGSPAEMDALSDKADLNVFWSLTTIESRRSIQALRHAESGYVGIMGVDSSKDLLVPGHKLTDVILSGR